MKGKFFIFFVCYLVLVCQGQTPTPSCPDTWVVRVGEQEERLWAFPQEDFETVTNYYRYGRPDGSSANTGVEDDNSDQTSVFFVRTNDGMTSLVVIHDKPRDGSGGRATTLVNHNGDLTGASFQVTDERNEGTSSNSNQFRVRHRWLTCCTDGFALGPIPEGSCFNITIQDTENINSVRVGTAAKQNGFPIQVSNDGTVKIEICTAPRCAPEIECGDLSSCDGVITVPVNNNTSTVDTDFQDYNVIVFEDFVANTGDVEGRLAVGRNLSLGNGYSIGDKLYAGNYNESDENLPYSLVVGGSAVWGSGRLYPDGSALEYAFVGNEFHAPNDLLERRTSSCEGNSGCLDTFFANAQTCYSDLSNTYCSIENFNIESWEVKYSGLFINCQDSSLLEGPNVINLESTVFDSITYISVGNCNLESEWVINVRVSEGNNPVISGDLFPGLPGRTVYNFCFDDETQSGCHNQNVTIRNLLNGNVLAPGARVIQEDGTIIGRVIACNFLSEGQSQVNRPCNELSVTLQGAIEALIRTQTEEKRSGSVSKLQVVSFGGVVTGDEIEIVGAGRFQVVGRETQNNQNFLLVTPELSNAAPGQKFSAQVEATEIRFNLNEDVAQGVPEGCIEGVDCTVQNPELQPQEPSSASFLQVMTSLLVCFTFCFLF